LFVVVVSVCDEALTLVPACVEVFVCMDAPADTVVSSDVSPVAGCCVAGSGDGASGDAATDEVPSTGVALGETVSDPFVDPSVVGSVVA